LKAFRKQSVTIFIFGANHSTAPCERAARHLNQQFEQMSGHILLSYEALSFSDKKSRAKAFPWKADALAYCWIQKSRHIGGELEGEKSPV
jgi:hypothetical protein